MSRYAVEAPEPQKQPRPKRGGKRMDPFYILMLILIVAVVALTASVVVFFASSGRYAAAASSEPGTSSGELSSGVESGAENSFGIVSENTDSGTSVSASSGSAGGEAASGTPVSAADAFEENSVDRAKETGMAKAGTTSAMLKVYDTALTDWQTALSDMVQRLKNHGVDAAAAQTHWVTAMTAQVAAREKELNQEGGSLQQVSLAEYRYQLYRDRALELFAQLYALEPDYLF